ncbi:hypothetical protein CWATWH0401_4504 [Crocosphaera watsonii WH 0401]|uniref:Uncharacterized protein n=2 Tax=Crocosphaera watsonii TaxID=263511 RepID=G5JBE8_CROWT|nr:hypothetical protein CWATWH0003_4764 [Crocosphaera watsonii WH 0003]CCQ63166.1 hypothetical protein CWATWH0401_4504 [Crocosphaera watsonii WH 0401]
MLSCPLLIIVDLMNFPPSPRLPVSPSPRQTPRISFLQKWDAPYG